jgi:predicted Zn-dependent peptidase
MHDRYFTFAYPNGLNLLCERMPGMKSVAMSLLLPAGVASDPEGAVGSSTILSDLVLRGAGSRDSRTLTDYLDFLGLQRSSTVGTYHTRFAAAGVGGKVMESLAAYADVVMRPHMPQDGFDAARDLALQGLEGLDDEPRQLLLLALRKAHFAGPLGRNSMGELADVTALTLPTVRADFTRRYRAGGAILALAGDLDFAECKAVVAKHLGSLPSGIPADAVPTLPTSQPGTRVPQRLFQEKQTEQTHIGLAYDAIPETHPDYYVVRLASEVLGGGMSGRLFTEIREKKGLCYSVWAGYSSLRDRGYMMGYAGTSNDRAQETLDMFVQELHRLCDGVTQAELDRARIGIKSSVIMSGESTSSRAGAIAHDHFVRGRIRDLDEIARELDAVTLGRVNAFLRSNPPGDMTVVVLGPRELKFPA